jgi:Amt family ammonium transporter
VPFLVLFMHAGFAFLEVGTVRHKNQVNALVKILTDFGVSTLAYFFIGYQVAYATGFLVGADQMMDGNGFALVKFFFLLTFAAAIPAIISGGIAERAKFWPMMVANVVIVALIYPLFEGMIWNGNFGFQQWIEDVTGAGFHDFAGSIVVHGMGGLAGADCSPLARVTERSCSRWTDHFFCAELDPFSRLRCLDSDCRLVRI